MGAHGRPLILEYRQLLRFRNQVRIFSPIISYPKSPTIANYRTDIMSFIDSVVDEQAIIGPGIIIVTTERTTSTTTPLSTTTRTPGGEEQEEPQLEKVKNGDLELAIQYLINKEIPAQQTLDEPRMNTVYQMLESILKYLPLRQALRNFLITLRDWPIRMEFKAVSGQHFSDKV